MKEAKSSRYFKNGKLFDPEKGKTILEPIKREKGYWVGAPSVLYDEEKKKFYLYYRFRQPRGVNPDRGFECHIAESEDGIRFSNIWEAKKENFPTSSVEKSSLFKTPDGKYLLYISYVDQKDNRWRIDVMESNEISAFKLSNRKKIFTADDISAEGIKDPYVFSFKGKYYMIVSYAPTPSIVTNELRKKMHETGDVYNTGKTKSHTGLAESHDGINFRWLGDILSPGNGWDSYASRISSLIYYPPLFVAFYDGSKSVEENYEEKTGIAVTMDLKHYKRLTEEKPYLVSPHGSGSLRYMDAVDMGKKVFYYYEYSREDGSHELRVNIIGREQ